MPPLVSVAFPLYRSRRFVDLIARNIEQLDVPSAEVLISDRHLDDDAIDVLEARFAGDTRVRFLRAADRIGWVDHYNQLLRAASGTYFLWIPHDDSNAPGYIAALIHCLERNPTVMLAFGNVEVAGVDGDTRWPITPRQPAGPWTLESALRTLMFDGQWLPHFHGVFRRDPVVSRALWIKPTTGCVEADLYWVFAVGLLGELRYVNGCSYRKRLDGSNVSVGWGRRRMSHVLDGVLVPYGYMRSLSSRGHRLRALPVLVAWAGLRTIGRVTQSWSWPAAAQRGTAKQLVQRLLFGRQ